MFEDPYPSYGSPPASKPLLGLELGPSVLQMEGGWDLVSLLCNATRGRRPCGLTTPCRGTRLGLISSRLLLGVLCHGHNRGLLHGLLAGGLLGGIFISNCRLSYSLASNVAWINIRGRTNKEEIMPITITTSNFIKNKESAEDIFSNLQVGAPMRRREEPCPGPPSRRCRSYPSTTYRLDVHGRRVPSYPTRVDRRDIRVAARSLD